MATLSLKTKPTARVEAMRSKDKGALKAAAHAALEAKQRRAKA